MNFYLEPYIFAINPEQIDKATFEKYINTLIEWKDFKDMDWGKIYLLSATYEYLYSNGYYPFTDRIKSLIDEYEITYVSTNDIDRVLNQFLRCFPKIDCDIDILHEYKNGSFNIDLSHRPVVFNDALCELSGLISLKKSNLQEGESVDVLFTKDVVGKIEFQSIFDIIEENEAACRSFCDIFPCFDSFYSYCISADTPLLIWKNAKKKEDYEMALASCIMQECKYENIKYSFDRHNFYFQDSFITSVTNLNFDNINSRSISVLKALKETVLGVNLAKVHALRENLGANSHQLNHNKHKAWRKDIDYEYHLHYWSKSENFKFADIVPHNVFTITREN